MKIGILSDTHTKVQKAKATLDLLLANGAEFIVHAGDVCQLETLELLKNCGKRYVAVYGNNDAHLVQHHNDFNLVQEPHHFKLSDTKFKLMHMPFYMVPDSEIIIFGHTHQFEVEMSNGTLYLNPGESCARNKPISECAILEITKEKFLVKYFTKHNEEKEFHHENFSFTRSKRD